MRFVRSLLTLGALTFLSIATSCFAADEDPYCEYIEYRIQPELGQIVISSNYVRGTVGVNRMTRSADELTNHGIIPCTGDRPRIFYRKTKISGKTFETLIVAEPPAAGDEENAGTWNNYVIVLVDGVKKIDCGLGTVTSDDISIYSIQLFPEDDCLMMTATDADGKDLSLPEGAEKLDEETVIGNGTLTSPDDEEEPDENRETPV